MASTLGVVLVGAVWGGVVVALLVAMLFRRDYQPLKSCGFLLLLNTALGCILTVTVLYLEMVGVNGIHIFPEGTFCEIWAYVIPYAYTAQTVPYFLRAYRLSYLFNYDTRGDTKKLIGQKNYMKESHLLVLFGLLIVILYALRVFFVLVGLPTSVKFTIVMIDCAADNTLTNLAIVWEIIHLIELVAVLYVIRNQADIREEFSMCTELKVLSLIWSFRILALFFLLLMQWIPNLESLIFSLFDIDQSTRHIRDHYYWHALSAISVITSLAMLSLSIAWPVIVTFLDPMVPLWSNSDALRSLDALLKDMMCVQYFRKFLAQEQTVENWLCWVEIELYKDIENEEERHVLAKKISETFLEFNAEYEVDVTGPSKKRVHDDIDNRKATRDTFSSVQHEIFNQMLHKSFPRFLASTICETLIEKLDKEENLHDSLVFSGMIYPNM